MSEGRQKQVMVLKKSVKKKPTRKQKILRNVVLVIVMIGALFYLRAGTFTAEQAYQKQLAELGITERSMQEGTVRVISDTSFDEPVKSNMEEWNEIWVGESYEYRWHTFDPIRLAVLETTAGGYPVRIRIAVGRYMIFWYDAVSSIEYPGYEVDPGQPGYTYNDLRE